MSREGADSERAVLRGELAGLVQAGLPGAFVYADDPDGSALFATAGVADLESGTRMTPDSRYRIGSTTKTFTAVVVLQLVAEGRIRLRDLVARWLSGREIPNGDSMTVEHLLRMRSGLFDFVDAPSLLDLDANRVPHTLEESIALGLAGKPTFLPGERSAYCNTNFCLLEAVVEAVTGRSLGEEIEARILGPLELRHTTYPAEQDLSLPAPYIRGYDRGDGEWRECSEVFYGRGDGAMISSALDLSRFFRALLGGGGVLLPDELVRQMHTVVVDDPPPEYDYGLGLIADTLPCGTVWGHSGGGFGYRHLPFLDRETGRFVVCMLNGTHGFRVTAHPPEAPPRFTPEMRCLAYRCAL